MRLSCLLLIQFTLALLLPVKETCASPYFDNSVSHLNVLTEHFPPYNYEENGKLTGYSTELLQAVLKEAGIEASYTSMPWVRAYLSASTQANTLLYTTTRTKERENIFEWIGPIGPRKMFLFKLSERKDIQIKNRDDLKNYRVGIVRDTSAIKLVVDQGLFPKRQIDEAPSTTSNMKKLFFHRVDLILATNGGAIYELSKLPYQKNEIEATYTLDEEFQFYFALNKQSDPGMIEKIRHAFDKVKASGLMENLRKKYSVD